MISQAIPADEEIEANFRRESARLTAALTRAFGAQHLALAEDVVQETFVRAIHQWSARGIPPNPGAWLSRVARNLAIDTIRRERIYAAPDALEHITIESGEASLMDDELAMLFLCSHPSLPEESQIALVLKTLCGLGVGEIAKGMLTTHDAIAQRLVRAKTALRDSHAQFEMPSDAEMRSRLRTVLRVLYLLFNEGYLAHLGPELTNSELCDEAIILTSRLVNTSAGNQPEAHALLALMLLNSSRLPARVDEHGALCLLEEQDRTKWDRSRIAAGLQHLALAAAGSEMTPYHCEAAIAAVHSTAPSFAETDWAAVLGHYDDLLQIAPSPIGRLNRIVALSRVSGPATALQELEPLATDRRLSTYYLLPATRARFLEELDRPDEAQAEYQRALELATNDAEKNFLRTKTEERAH